jgi:hypothetical protein
MKTAMQELLIDLMINLETEIGHKLNMEKFKPFLEKEKEQIIEAYSDGHCIKDEFYNPKEYYKNTYNQNK